MKVEVDLDLCQGHAMCELEEPEVFEVPRRSKVRLLEEEPSDALSDGVRRAVESCPTQALRVREN
jgi:ferredoxin